MIWLLVLSFCFCMQGIFITFVMKDSPGAMGGLRFGDQILQINGENVAGYSKDKAMGVLKKASPGSITLAIRDRYIITSQFTSFYFRNVCMIWLFNWLFTNLLWSEWKTWWLTVCRCFKEKVEFWGEVNNNLWAFSLL